MFSFSFFSFKVHKEHSENLFCVGKLGRKFFQTSGAQEELIVKVVSPKSVLKGLASTEMVRRVVFMAALVDFC